MKEERGNSTVSGLLRGGKQILKDKNGFLTGSDFIIKQVKRKNFISGQYKH
jgi:hypothetical protein